MNPEKELTARPVQRRLLIPLALVLLLMIGGFAIVLLITHQQSMRYHSRCVMADTTRNLETLFVRQAEMLTALEDIILQNTDLHAALQSRDRERLLAENGPIFQKLKENYSVTHFYIHRPDRVNLIRIHKPEKYGDLIDRFTLMKAEHSGKTSWGIELGPLGTFTLRVVQPVRMDGTLIGYLELGQEIEGMLSLVHQQHEIDLAVSIHKNALNRQQWESGMEMLGREGNWDRFENEVLIYYSQPFFPSEYDRFVDGGGEPEIVPEELKLNKKSWLIQRQPLEDASSVEVGSLLLFQDITEEKSAFTWLVVLVTGFALFLFGSLFALFFVMLRRTDQGIQAQQIKLDETEERQCSLLNAISRSGILLFVVDDEYRVRYANEAMKDIFEDLEGSICYRAVVDNDSPCSHCRIEEVIGGQKTVYYQSVLANHRSYNMIAVPYVDTDGTPCKLEVMQDITEQRFIEHEKKMLEQQLLRAQKMEAIGLMAGGVAHDLNNILSGIVSYPELILLKLPKDSELREYVEAIQESGQRAATVVADLLTVARGVAAAREVYDINSLAQEYLVSPECSELKTLYPSVTLEQQLDASRPDISCSPVHIKKCLMNLVTNAAEAIDGEGSVMVSTRNQRIEEPTDAARAIEAGDYVVLSVRDTGPGISDEDLEHIFEPFYSKKVMGRSGSGLGLAVVWNTIKDHQGKIHVESNAEGTCFHLYFPVVGEGEEGVQAESNENGGVVGNGEHILVVDDEPQLRDIACKILQTMGYKVDSVSSGEQALCFLKKEPVDLLVIDMSMEPGMSGRQTYEEIIKLYPDAKAIIASGFSAIGDVEATLQLGARGYIKKPYSMGQLGRAVHEALHS